jgi:GxxExxY protein
MKSVNQVTEIVIGRPIEVHKALGPGLLESAYKACLRYELLNAVVEVKTEVPLPLVYKEVHLECGYRADFVVENKVIIELKAVDALNDIHVAQSLTYLKLSNCKIGLLINFNLLQLTKGLRRLINKHYIEPH